MTNIIQFLRDGELSQLNDRLMKILSVGKRFPDQVFLSKMRYHYFFDIDSLFSPDFWRLIRSIGCMHKDQNVWFIVLDPDPIQYYYREFGYCNAFRISVTADEGDYYYALSLAPEGSPADSIINNSNLIACLGSHDAWAVWAERDAGIGVIGACQDLKSLDDLGLFTMPIDYAINIAIQSLSIVDTQTYRSKMLYSYND